jgi:hypothetical protein
MMLLKVKFMKVPKHEKWLNLIGRFTTISRGTGGSSGRENGSLLTIKSLHLNSSFFLFTRWEFQTVIKTLCGRKRNKNEAKNLQTFLLDVNGSRRS